MKSHLCSVHSLFQDFWDEKLTIQLITKHISELCVLLMHILEINGVLAGCGCQILIEGVRDFAWICELLFTIPDDQRVGVVSRGQRVGVVSRGQRVGVVSRGQRVGVVSRGQRVGVVSRGQRVGVVSRGQRVGVVSRGQRVGVVSRGQRVGVVRNELKHLIQERLLTISLKTSIPRRLLRFISNLDC